MKLPTDSLLKIARSNRKSAKLVKLKLELLKCNSKVSFRALPLNTALLVGLMCNPTSMLILNPASDAIDVANELSPDGCSSAKSVKLLMPVTRNL
mmetsp:Transcript_20318/g.46585  ORF Transcript_20318/g.46585 Transcript_20318/m.46585 type:complete len:95 (+) Transcript_20318:55-339(+)